MLGSWGCTRHFRSLNTDKTGVSYEDLRADMNHLRVSLNVIQQGIYFNYDYGKGKNWPFQLIQNLNADMYSGYMHDPTPLNGGSHNSDYNMQDGWNGTCWDHIYSYIFPQIKRMEDSTRVEFPAFYGITRILKVEVMHRVSDIYGPVVYSTFGHADLQYQPDSQQKAYELFFAELGEAIELLGGLLESEVALPDLARFDILLDGRYESWIRFANSLRARLAIRVAMVDPVLGKSEFLKSLQNPYGMLEEAGLKVAVSTRDGYVNPLGEINRAWDEVAMSASMESILLGFDDPRLPAYFEPCAYDVVLPGSGGEAGTIRLKGSYKGVRQGTLFSHKYYMSHSKIYTTSSSEAVLMTPAEVWFLRAEAALRGWTAEDVRDCYEQGIRCSFEQWNVGGLTDYLQRESHAIDFVDALDATNNIIARCRVTPRWDESASDELKLERIITQKWLAMFPEGCEAWAEQRRTGYPRLFPVKVNNSKGGCVDTETMIRRLSFSSSIPDANAAQYQELVRLLGGDDHEGTRLWWDTGRNF